MQKMYNPIRVGLVFVILAAMLSVFLFDLYRMQIYETWLFDDAPPPLKVFSRSVTLPAARGNIYDRNGVLLASGRPSYNLRLDRSALRASPNINETIQELVYAAMDADIQYIDTLPITRGAPFGYVSEMTREQRRRLDAYFAYYNIDPDISASELLAWLRRNYDIDFTVGILDARVIIGVRYELEIRAIVGNIAPYIFAREVGTDFVSLVEERGFVGVYPESSYIREYHTSYGAHVLGYIAPIAPEMVERYVDELNYPRDALVGRIGAEYAFEDRLRGKEGRQIIRTDAEGTVRDVLTVVEPEPGNHIYLTLDIDLQIVTEHSLQAQIDLINLLREEDARDSVGPEDDVKITGGSVVVTDVRTGEILAAASYPTFDPANLSRNYALLSADPMNPLLNRTTHGRYIPGSTFKMITAFAGLRHGVVNRYTEIDDVGRFTKYVATQGAFAPSCWIYPISGVGHGRVNVVQALECSCNYFFMSVADWVRIRPAEGEQSSVESTGGPDEAAMILAGVAQEFGLGTSTGIEIPENIGRLATPEWKREAERQGLVNDGRWYSADTVVTGFGQGDNRFTPLQLANYTATIANGGTRHAMTILKKVVSSDFSETLHTHEPVVVNQVAETEYIEILKEGMEAVARGTYGTAKSVFSNYPIRVAAKTGTAQVEGRDINDGIFVCYAPASNPEIAISIVVEKGGSGSAVMDIARMIFDYYFRPENSVLTVPYGELIL